MITFAASPFIRAQLMTLGPLTFWVSLVFGQPSCDNMNKHRNVINILAIVLYFL